MERSLLIVALAAALAGCPLPAPQEQQPSQASQGTALDSAFAKAKAFAPLNLSALAPNVYNDTMVVQETRAIGDGLFLMAARNVQIKREGLRLYLYRPRTDSSAEVLAVSKPAYDSEVLQPTVFSTGDTADGLIILANYGTQESWGQNVYWLKDRRFTDLGWLDVTKRDWRSVGDSSFPFLENIAPFTKVKGLNGRFLISFSSDSVQLFDDLRGNREVMLPSARIQYESDSVKLMLVIDGVARKQKPL